MDDEFTSNLNDVRDRFDELVGRLRAFAAESEKTMQWFAMWAPVVAAGGRLATTLGRVVLQLRKVAAGEATPLWTEEDRAHIAAELSHIAADFPDVAEVIFGLSHIDDLIEALMADEGARQAASQTFRAITGLLDGLLSRMVDIALTERETDVGPDRILAFMERFEETAESLVNPWVQRALGVSRSEANIE